MNHGYSYAIVTGILYAGVRGHVVTEITQLFYYLGAISVSKVVRISIN